MLIEESMFYVLIRLRDTMKKCFILTRAANKSDQNFLPKLRGIIESKQNAEGSFQAQTQGLLTPVLYLASLS